MQMQGLEVRDRWDIRVSVQGGDWAPSLIGFNVLRGRRVTRGLALTGGNGCEDLSELVAKLIKTVVNLLGKALMSVLKAAHFGFEDVEPSCVGRSLNVGFGGNADLADRDSLVVGGLFRLSGTIFRASGWLWWGIGLIGKQDNGVRDATDTDLELCDLGDIAEPKLPCENSGSAKRPDGDGRGLCGKRSGTDKLSVINAKGKPLGKHKRPGNHRDVLTGVSRITLQDRGSSFADGGIGCSDANPSLCDLETEESFHCEAKGSGLGFAGWGDGPIPRYDGHILKLFTLVLVVSDEQFAGTGQHEQLGSVVGLNPDKRLVDAGIVLAVQLSESVQRDSLTNLQILLNHVTELGEWAGSLSTKKLTCVLVGKPLINLKDEFRVREESEGDGGLRLWLCDLNRIPQYHDKHQALVCNCCGFILH